MHSRQKRSPLVGQTTGSRERARQSLQASKGRKEFAASFPLRVP